MSIKFVIVGAARTGSTLLVRTLNSIEGVCCHGELLGMNLVRGYEDGFDPISASKEQREERSARLLQERNSDPVGFMRRTLNAEHKATGFKALYSSLLQPQWHEVITLLQSMQDIKLIHLTRRNELRRYISEQILLEGGPVHSGAGGRSETAIKVRVDIDAFLQKSALLEAQAQELGSLLSMQGALHITYEELAADTTGTVNHVCQFLGLPAVPQNIQPALKKVGATDLQDSVINYQELLDNPATRALVLSD